MTLRDQRVVVMGGTSGIGLATAKAAEGLGAEVVVTGRDEARLRAAQDAIGDNVTATRVDATDREQLVAFFSRVGELDHLVLCASGGAGAGPIAELDLGDLRAGFDAKFWAHVGSLQAALPFLRSGGSITFVSAASAGSPLAGVAGLAAINGALEAMVPGLAIELKPTRVNAVSPGVVDTPWWHGIPEEQRAAMFADYAAAAPVGRVGAAEDVAHGIICLVTNGFITGNVLTVDGGLTLSSAS